MNRHQLIQTASAILLACSAAFTGCDIINPEEEVPTYVRIDSVQVLPNPDLGSASSKITGVYAFMSNKALGVFELPVTIPVIASEPGIFQILPAVDFSGIHSQLDDYPFYLVDTFTLNPAPGNTVVHNATTRYVTNSKLAFSEDFETGSQFKAKISGDTSIVRVTEGSMVFEGGGSGYLYLDSGQTAEVTSLTGATLSGSVNNYIEINYKSSMDFQVGLQAFTTSGDILEYRAGFVPRDSWNKVYIPITAFVAAYPASAYHIVFKARPNDGKANGYVLFDNIKIVTNL